MAESAPAAMDTRSVVLTYHSVGRREHEMNVSPVAFREQMRWLADHCRTIPASHAADGGPGIAVTFDDGYRDNLIEAAPVMSEFGIPATVFYVSGCAGGHLEHDDRNDESARLMTWDELRELAAGGWEVGGHTRTHRRLSGLSRDEQADEIEGCKADIEGALGVPVTAFAYPFGSSLDFTAVSAALVRGAGYACGFSNRFGVNSTERERFALRRIWIDRSDTLASFASKVEGRLDRMAWLDSPVGIRARRWANRLLRST